MLPRSLTAIFALAAGAAALLIAPARASAQSCTSMDPAQWPAASKPYFMMVMDTSGSMITDVGVASSCSFGSTRIAHARCAMRNTVLAFGGQVNFGLSTFAVDVDACAGATCT